MTKPKKWWFDKEYFWAYFHSSAVCFLHGFFGGGVILLGIGEITDKTVNLLSWWNIVEALKIFFISGTTTGLIALANRLRMTPPDYATLLKRVDKDDSDSIPPAES